MPGSIDFNATTSKLEHTTANVLNSVTAITVCCWAYADGRGESNAGRIICLDEAGGTASVQFGHDASSNGVLFILKGAGGVGTAGTWTIPAVDGQWNALAFSLDFSGDNAPIARVNFADVTETQAVAPVGIQDQPATGYCIGNLSNGSRTWDGRIAHMQVFNAVKSAADMDAALRNPGSVTDGLRLYIPMTSATDTNDASGNGFNGTATDLTSSASGPPMSMACSGGACVSLGIGV